MNNQILIHLKKIARVSAFLALTIFLFLIISSMTNKKITNASVSGLRLQPETWSGTIHVTGDVSALLWNPIRILPGTRVLFDQLPYSGSGEWTRWADGYIIRHGDPTGRTGFAKARYSISAKIIALGTSNHPILFTSSAIRPEYADWDQLVLSKDSRLEHVELAYSHNGANVAGSNVVIRNSKIHDSLWSCVDIFSDDNLIEGNEIYHCWHQGIGVKGHSQNLLKNNFVHDAQTSVNCEYGAQPMLIGNRFKAAYLTPECGEGIGTTIEDAPFDVPGGIFNGRLVYPAGDD